MVGGYRAGYAPSSVATCKKCYTNIEKGDLRLATLVQSRSFDGKQAIWFHFGCFFEEKNPKSLSSFQNIDQLRWEDQKKIKSAIKGEQTGESGSSNAGKTETKNDTPDFFTEYAKSNRSTCGGCEQKIAKMEIRISRKKNSWHHVACFVANRDELEFSAAADKLNGFQELNKEDQELLKTKLPALKTATKRPAKDAKDERDSKKSKQEKDEEAKLKKQNQEFFGFRDDLEHQLKKKELQLLLEYNDMEIPAGESRMLDRLSDAMCFGVTLPCTECRQGQLVYDTKGYRCQGNMTAWTKCTNITKTPKRKEFKVPEKLKEDYPFLKEYKFQTNIRDFPSSVNRVLNTRRSCPNKDGPLVSMTFFMGKTNNKPQLITDIRSLAGKLKKKIDHSVTAVISSKDDHINDAIAKGIVVISEEYIKAVKDGEGGAINLFKKYTLHGEISQQVAKKRRNRRHELRKQKSKWRKGLKSQIKIKETAVDAGSELEDVAHVLKVYGETYNAILGKVDVARGTNSFYKLQILESDTNIKRYWLFRSWGRVGTSIGDKKVEVKKDREDAIKAFQELFLEKTGNRFGKRHVKYPGRFYLLDIDYGQDDDEKIRKLKEDFENSRKSKLERPIRDLICMIFNVETMEKALVEFKIDVRKMPLGKLSRKQIEKAYSVLTELEQLVESKASPPKFLDAANRFYTLIPHDFGVQKPSPLDNDEIIKEKIEMLDNLSEIEVAYSLLQSGDDSTKETIDALYQKLQTDLEVLDRTSSEFQLIQKYVKNTHVQTHKYGLQIVDVFKVNRHGEDKLYEPFKTLHNRKLLWHGSRVTNFASILKNGLLISPPEVPKNGDSFGKGVYFADMVARSLTFCKSNSFGLLLLCEVALGNMHELKRYHFITKLPKGKHSTKGLGNTIPLAAEKVMCDDGVEIPLGKAKRISDGLLPYNEYVVYDVAQINMKYLLKMRISSKF